MSGVVPTARGVPVDAVVVGASAAGLLTAQRLAQAGRLVRVVERVSSLDPSPRVLIVTSHLMEVAGGASDRAVKNRIRRFELHSNGSSTSFSLGLPDLVIERSALIEGLAQAARDAGATVEFGSRFLSLDSDGSALTVTLARRDGSTAHLRARTVVGADGAFSRVARAAGWPQQPTVPLVQAVIDLPSDIPQDVSHVWFRPQDTPYFFWLVPESDSRAVVGVIGEHGPATRVALDRFLAEQGMAALEYQAARIPRYDRWIDPKGSEQNNVIVQEIRCSLTV